MNDQTQTDDSRFGKVEEIFNQVVDQSQRDTKRMLDELCGNDTQLRSEVQRLLALEDDQLAGFMAAPESKVTELGSIAGYTIIEQIGEGGMGSVFLAEQENPRRKVALKTLKSGFAAPEIRQRFQYEAQLLGQLQHPGIAQIYEAGSMSVRNPAGVEIDQPYFAMELVDGVPLSEYVSNQELTVPDKLRLMIDICDAVQSAHQRGVIHRDLKPGNILVAKNGQPKILDFGVARLVDSEQTQGRAVTRTGQLIGTLSYMSPEQISGDPTRVDTRSDIYSIGVLLYETLAGKLPYDLKDAPIADVAKIITDVEPNPLNAVSRSFRGDLDWIVMKSLEKDRTRRYQTANGFAQDILRYLNDEPVTASPPSAAYRLRKFVRRNRGPVIAAGLVAVVLIAGMFGTITFAVNASQQRKLTELQKVRAQESYRLAHEALTTSINKVVDDPRMHRGEMEDLRREVQGIQADFYRQFVGLQGDDAEFQLARGRALNDLARITAHLGKRAEAQNHSAEAIQLFEQLVQQDPENRQSRRLLCDARLQLAKQIGSSGNLDDAEKLYLQVIPELTDLLDRDSNSTHDLLELATAYMNVGMLYRFRLHRAREADDEVKKSIAEAATGRIRDGISVLQRLAEYDPDAAQFRLAVFKYNIATILIEMRDVDEVKRLANEAIVHLKAVPPDDDKSEQATTLLGDCYNVLAFVYRNSGQLELQKQAYIDAIDLLEPLSAEHPLEIGYSTTLGNLQNNLGVWYYDNDKPADALEWFDKSTGTLAPLLDRYPEDLQIRSFLRNAHKGYAQALTELELHVEALVHWEKTLEMDTGQYVNWFSLQKARTLARLERINEATRIAEERVSTADPRAQTLLDAGTVFALSATHSASDSPEQARYMDRAIELLKQAVAKQDFDKPDKLANDPDLDILRGRDDFQQLVAELTKNGD